MSDKLTDRQERFCREYLIDLNATQAAIRAGYSEKTAGTISNENMQKPAIKARIIELKQERSRELKIDAEWVLKQHVAIHQLDVIDILDNTGSFKPIMHWPKDWRMYLSGLDLQEINSGDTESIVRKIKWPDKVKNLELIARHIEMKDLAERLAEMERSLGVSND